MVELLVPSIDERRTEGGRVFSARTPLPKPARAAGDWLVRWARERPEVVFLAERDARGAWVRLSYARALERVERIAEGLLGLGATPEQPVMVLSDNSIDSAMVMLGAMHAGVPVAPISPAYSLLSKTFGRLREVAAQLEPRFVFADDLSKYQPAIDNVNRSDTIVLSSTSLDDLAREPTTALREAFAKLGPETIAKILFTSGSTGSPKGVINTQRMLTSNQESMAACWPFLARKPPIVVDWLPWSHTFGGNHNFFLILRNGGSLYLDRGRPAPGLIETTIHNLADISPTLWFNVPRGFDQAVALLEKDEIAAAKIFRNLDLVFYAAAALSPQTRARLEKVAERVGRAEVFFTSAWGSTETAPLATSAHFPTRTTGILGVPVPGVELKLAPVQDKLELRVRGPNVTPGYWRPKGQVVPVALDEDGFLPTGDAGRLVEEQNPNAGVVFAGRLSENFKLSSGTWVNVAEVRLALVDACAPLVLDAVIAGHDRDAICALLFLAPASKDLAQDELKQRLSDAVARHNTARPGSSERIEHALICREPLSLDEGETTDKGYTNQRRVLERRTAEVARVFAATELVL